MSGVPGDYNAWELSNTQVTYALVITVGTLIVITGFLVASIVCMRRRYLASVARGTAGDERGARLAGLDEAALEACPKMNYRWEKLFRSRSEAERRGTCSICLSEYTSSTNGQGPSSHHGDVVRVIPHCGHIFHADCVDDWLRRHGTCPVCRTAPINMRLSVADVPP